MKFGCPELSKKCLTFETFVWQRAKNRRLAFSHKIWCNQNWKLKRLVLSFQKKFRLNLRTLFLYGYDEFKKKKNLWVLFWIVLILCFLFPSRPSKHLHLVLNRRLYFSIIIFINEYCTNTIHSTKYEYLKHICVNVSILPAPRKCFFKSLCVCVQLCRAGAGTKSH